MNNLIADLARTRAHLEEVKKARKHLILLVTESPAYKDLEKLEQEYTAAEAQISEVLKQNGLDAFALDDTNKKPLPGVGIQVSEKPKYDELLAIVWCYQNLMDAIKLDAKLFEAHAKAVRKTKPIEFVEWVEERKATIASDLSKYLEVDEAKSQEAEIPFRLTT